MSGLGDVEAYISPLERFGFISPFWRIEIGTVLNTWVAMAAIFITILFIRYFLADQVSIVRYGALTFIQSFVSLVEQTIGSFEYSHFAMVTAVFIFILYCNCMSILPWFEEPTQALNTTLALGIVTFVYKEFYTIKVHGFSGYLQEFIQPFFLMFPLNVIGHLSKVVSMSFRLFGNIFGGSIISKLYGNLLASSIIWQLIGLFTGLNLLMTFFFGIFEGLVQAFVFAMLTLTYLSIAIQEE